MLDTGFDVNRFPLFQIYTSRTVKRTGQKIFYLSLSLSLHQKRYIFSSSIEIALICRSLEYSRGKNVDQIDFYFEFSQNESYRE